jgi:hypothetical protein
LSFSAFANFFLELANDFREKCMLVHSGTKYDKKKKTKNKKKRRVKKKKNGQDKG